MTSYPAHPPPTVTYQSSQSPLQHFQYGPPVIQYLPVQYLKPHPTRHTLPPGDLSSVTPQIASQAIQSLLSTQLRSAGYDSAQPPALRRLELEVVACEFIIAIPICIHLKEKRVHLVVEVLYRRAHEYANLANRAGPIATDLLLASAECGLQTKDLHKLGAKPSRKKRRGGRRELT